MTEIYSIGHAADWVNIDPIDTSSLPENPDSPFFYPLIDYQELVLDSEIHSYQRTIQVVNDSSRIENASLLLHELNEKNQNIVLHAIHIIRDGQIIDSLDTENIKCLHRERTLESHITTDRITVSISIDDLRVGDAIDYAFTIIETANEHPLLGKEYHANFWLTWGCYVSRQSILINNHSNRQLNFRECEAADGKQNYTTGIIEPQSQFSRVYTDLYPVNYGNSLPSWFWTSFLQVLTDNDWKKISSDFYTYYQDIGALSDNIDIAGIEGLSTDSRNTGHMDIIRFVQNNVRYKGENHGIYSHTPKSPDRTLKKRAGDCKDKSNLLCILLRSAGYEANLVLVNSQYGHKIQELSPSPYHFNHMIVELIIEGNSHFFDPTIQKQYGDLDHYARLDYGYGLRISPDKGELVKISRSLAATVFELEHHFDFGDYHSGKNPKLLINRKYTFHRADNMRFHFDAKDKRTYQEEFLNWAKEDTGMDLHALRPIEVTEDDRAVNLLKTVEEYEIQNIENTHTDGKISILTDFYKNFPIPVTEEWPAVSYCDGIMQHTISVKSDFGSNPDSTEFAEDNIYFKYKDRVWKEKNYTHSKTRLEPLQAFIPAENLSSHIEAVKKIQNRSRTFIPFRDPKQSKVNKPGYWNFALSFLAIYILIKLAIAALNSS